jgi:hypothetical protein
MPLCNSATAAGVRACPAPPWPWLRISHASLQALWHLLVMARQPYHEGAHGRSQ